LVALALLFRLFSKVEGFALKQYLFGEFLFPFSHKGHFVFFFSQFVRQHLRDFVSDWIPPRAFGADYYAFCNLFCFFKNVEFQWIVFVDWTRKDIH